jgi:hypothetical protein
MPFVAVSARLRQVGSSFKQIPSVFHAEVIPDGEREHQRHQQR